MLIKYTLTAILIFLVISTIRNTIVLSIVERRKWTDVLYSTFLWCGMLLAIIELMRNLNFIGG